jgi:hypothetical protein
VLPDGCRTAISGISDSGVKCSMTMGFGGGRWILAGSGAAAELEWAEVVGA